MAKRAVLLRHWDDTSRMFSSAAPPWNFEQSGLPFIPYFCNESMYAEVFQEVQHITAQHSTAQHSTAQHSTAQHSTAQHSTAQHSTAQHSTAQHSTAQHSTAEHSTAQHSTAWPNVWLATASKPTQEGVIWEGCQVQPWKGILFTGTAYHINQCVNT